MEGTVGIGEDLDAIPETQDSKVLSKQSYTIRETAILT